jgi:aminopeptidase N
VASNGVLQSEKVTEVGEGDARGTPAKWRTFHWKVHNPIANYAVALNIAPYEIVETTFHSVGGEAVPVAFYALPEDEVRARRRLPEFLDHLRFFEELLGPYPFRNEKYGVAQTPHLGMEHQTIIAYGYDFQHDAYGYDWLHHHEASHEWWANLVTCRDWKDMWLHEGFGTYMQFLYVERMHGAEGMQRHMSERRREIHNARPVAPELSADSKGIYFGNTEERDNDIYYKGAWVLHTLRYLIGDEAFFASLRRFAYPTAEMEKVTDGSQVRFADTNDYRKLVEQTTVRDLGWFFDVYLHQPKLPKLQYRRDREGVQLTWTVPEGHEFEMPVPVRIDGEIQRIAMPGGKGQFDLAEGKRIEIDPEHWILRD